MPDPTLLAEAALERLRQIMARWPRPRAGQAVRADAVRAGLAPLEPLALMVLTLPVGYGKGYYQGAGYLSGSPRITRADHDLANAVMRDLNVVLLAANERPLTRGLYGKIKEHAYKLLGLATDLDVTQGNLQKLGAAPGDAWDRWTSMAKVPPLVDAAAEVGAPTGDPHVDRAVDALARWLEGEGARPDDLLVRGGRLLLVYAPGRAAEMAKASGLAPPTVVSKRLGGSAVTLTVAVVAADDPAAVGAAAGWLAPRFRDARGTEWRWTGARGLDEAGRHVQTLRSSTGTEMRLAREDVEAFVRDGELTPLAPAPEVGADDAAAALGQAAPGQQPVHTAAEARMQATLARVTKFVAAFPRPTATQMVKAPETLAALSPLRPLALRVSQLKVGDKKGSAAPPAWIDKVLSATVPYQIARAIEGEPDPATGYLTGSATVTQDDINVGRWVLGMIDDVLPRYPAPTLAPVLYDEIRRKAHQLMMVGTDLDVDTTAADQVALLWQSFKEATQDFARYVERGAEAGTSLLKVGVIVAAAAAGIYGVKTLMGK